MALQDVERAFEDLDEAITDAWPAPRRLTRPSLASSRPGEDDA